MTRRIVHLIDTGGPGGAETVFSTLVNRFDEGEWRSLPVVPRSGWLEKHLRETGHDPLVEPTERAFDLGYLARLVRLLRRYDADLVQTHLLGSTLYGSVAARICGLPVVATFHGTVDVSKKDPFQAVKFRLLERTVSRFVFVSDTLRREFSARTGLPPEIGSVIHNGVDLGRYSTEGDGGVRQEIGVGRDDVLVGALGNVRPAKDYRLLLRAASLLREDPEPYRFVVVGEGHGRLWNELMSLRAELGLKDTVTFTGFREDVPRVLADLDLYLLTSFSEGFSLSTVQALATGLPVVATRCGGPEEIIDDGVHGRLVDRGSPEAVAAGVRELVRDPGKAHRLANAGRRRVEEEFSLDRMAERYEAVYDECLSDQRAEV